MKDEYRKLFTKEDALPPIVVPAKYRSYHDFLSCRNCGYTLASTVVSINYCANCGQRIKHAPTCGIGGWKKETADAEWKRMIEGRKEQDESKMTDQAKLLQETAPEYFDSLYEECKRCGNLLSSAECEMCEDFDMLAETEEHNE